LSAPAIIRTALAGLPAVDARLRSPIERATAEIEFATRLAQARSEHTTDWLPLVERAATALVDGLRTGRTDTASLAAEVEAVLAPMAVAAKQYTIHCVGHAHIDMNWMWSWPETVSVTYDTFATMDQLLCEFPDFHFSQSQASVYHAMRTYAPEVLDMIRRRVAEGRWEVTASQWVEGDKNLAGGEILCRHLLYTRQWLSEALGLMPDQVRIAWEPDTFGHCWTLPGILRGGGVSRYYHHRCNGPRLVSMASGETSQVFWWQGRDGQRILAFDDSPNGYNCEIVPHMTHLLFDLERHTGLRDLLWVYGVGDHGGGPTRRHLRAAQEMATWPVWPNVKLSTTDAFFSAVEADIEARGLDIPVHDGELNFVFEGCYTSESRIKFANRRGECDLVDTEAMALLAARNAGVAYDSEALEECWRRSMFIQFHDILPGSGVKETIEHAMGLFQENLAYTGIMRSRGLRALASRVDTSALAPAPGPETVYPDMGLGAGVGFGAGWSGMSAVGAGATDSDPFVIFNPAPFARDEIVRVKVWNRELRDDAVTVRDADGYAMPGQVLDRGNYWGHRFTTVAFPANAVPGVGYASFVVEPGAVADDGDDRAYAEQTGRPLYGLGYVQAEMVNPVRMGNGLIELVVCSQHGGIISLIDKASGCEFVQPGGVLGGIDREQEAPHGMTAWQLGPIVDRREPLVGGTLRVLHAGPHLATVALSGRDGESDYRLVISVARGSARVDFALEVNWLERGDAETGVPVLRTSLPLALEAGRARFEIPCGLIEREADGEEAPALNWVDLCGDSWLDDQPIGATLVNDCKYGHQLSDESVRLTLLRSSYDPDPLPEIGGHHIRWALVPHVGEFDAGAAVRAGYVFNHALVPVGTTVHSGDLPAASMGLEVVSPNVMISGLKKAEGSSALVVRLYEFTGVETDAEVRISGLMCDPDAPAAQVDVLERPLPDNTARMEGDTLKVTVPPFGIVQVVVG